MLSTKFKSYLGTIILIFTFSISYIFVKWVYADFDYQKAALYEQKAHILTARGKLKKAKYYFLKAASLNDNLINIARRYRCAGSVSASKEQQIKYFLLALKYNPNNTIARQELLRLKVIK